MADLAEDLTSNETDDLLDQAQGIVRGYCGWHIAPVVTNQSYVLTYWSDAILLPTLRLVAVTSIVDANGNDLTAGGFTATDGGILRRGSSAGGGYVLGYLWPPGTVVSFTHGYTTAPPEVTGVVQAVARRSIANPTSVVEAQTGPYSSIYGPRTGEPVVLGLTAGERSALGQYRIPVQ